MNHISLKTLLRHNNARRPGDGADSRRPDQRQIKRYTLFQQIQKATQVITILEENTNTKIPNVVPSVRWEILGLNEFCWKFNSVFGGEKI